jgi:hypothetical protein
MDKKKRKQPKEKPARDEPQAAPAGSKVPEWAENMEHTLRRLVRAREEKRSKTPGLYT